MFTGLKKNEAKKLATLALLKAEDKTRDRALGEFAWLASKVMGTSGYFVTIFDDDYQNIKSANNVPFPPARMPMSEVIYQHSVDSGHPVICPDTRADIRFKDHQLVKDGSILFYAAAPLKTMDGFVLGSLCVIDSKPFTPSQDHIDSFLRIADLSSVYLEARYAIGRVDALTGLPNRRQLLNDIEKLSEEHITEPYSLIIFDCIDMPQAYELSRYLGLAAVEKVLIDFSSLLRLRLNLKNETVLYTFATGRYALLVKSRNMENLIQKAAALPPTHAKITNDIDVTLHIHAGYVSFKPATAATAEVFRQAVSALHEAIKRVVPVQKFDPELDKKRNDEFRLLYDLGEAIKSEDQLYLVYQPKISLLDGHIEGVEALLRWQHPVKGNISPTMIVALAEKTSLMTEITNWVIFTTLEQLKTWRKMGIAIPISVNVTVSDLSSPGFADRLEDQILASALTPADLRIECLETEKVLESDIALNELNILKLRGFKILLDDFGAGYSNINYLRRIPIDIIKLDRSLISRITTDTGSRIIVKNIIVMLKELDYIVLAEGVEDEETAQMLKEFGCDEAQGYFFSKPVSAKQIQALFQQE
ncbi:histidine kinase [Brenneria goodwinii]|uniref:Histidine kinase n=1 Tax=Brenneria goodwinii TaxID=1109412 RepID=A0AAE8EQV0_9GAMM|nr:sensor domain-containing phosphodiesterase [Brenneria goodwinii]ATA23978.1 histidine kinase [Brenneria goodwinii]MCG8156613.1 sensor domain-containing phosphodiesterase [Brenneria goodwinii]MCG8159681.1 sensor domain-containing phosphodiesterase [Brenneria goodwinii]MCG8165771.1 sensor domain-containing phosphodiesterase [Brenneria goodwinii]MCG8170268.1 sensor domain-containing phosphodiesterase [Brenneria goodwinii]